MGITLVASSVVCLTSILIHLGLASTVVIAPIESYAYVSLSISILPIVTIIAVVIVATSTTFKQPMGQVLIGCLLFLSHLAMVIVLNELLIKLKTLIYGKLTDCLLDNSASHNFFSIVWCDQNGLDYEWGKWFSI